MPSRVVSVMTPLRVIGVASLVAVALVHGIPRTTHLDRLDALPDSLVRGLDSLRLIEVGELHGTNEGPLFVEGLLRGLTQAGKHVVLGLELPSMDQAALDDYMHGDDAALGRMTFFDRNRIQDGRSSVAWAKLLRDTRAFHHVRVIGFDENPVNATGEQRDSLMAVHVLAQVTASHPDVTVLLTGNTHAALDSLHSQTAQFFKHPYHSLGVNLLATPGSPFTRPTTFAAYERARSGAFWACMSDDNDAAHSRCGIHRAGRASPGPARYVLTTQDPIPGYDATLDISRVTPAVPFAH